MTLKQERTPGYFWWPHCWSATRAFAPDLPSVWHSIPCGSLPHPLHVFALIVLSQEGISWIPYSKFQDLIPSHLYTLSPFPALFFSTGLISIWHTVYFIYLLSITSIVCKHYEDRGSLSPLFIAIFRKGAQNKAWRIIAAQHVPAKCVSPSFGYQAPGMQLGRRGDSLHNIIMGTVHAKVPWKSNAPASVRKAIISLYSSIATCFSSLRCWLSCLSQCWTWEFSGPRGPGLT